MEDILDFEEQNDNKYTRKSFRDFILILVAIAVLFSVSFLFQLELVSVHVFNVLIAIGALLFYACAISGFYSAYRSIKLKESDTAKKWIAATGNTLFFCIAIYGIFINIMDVFRVLH